MSSTRRLKLSESEIGRILDDLDALESPSDGQAAAPSASPRYVYRVHTLRGDIEITRDNIVTHVLAARRIGRDGMSVLVGNLVHPGTPCTLYLVTIRNNWQTVTGKVSRCRYIQGTACVYEMDILFDRPIDPASFAPAAIRPRILLADDSAMARKLLSHVLSSMNVDVKSVENGYEAVQKAQSEPFDLILMDVEMPVLDGVSAIRVLRSKGYLRPIVAISANQEDDVRQRCLNAGCDEFVAKPAQRDVLAEVVQRTKPEPLVSSLLHDQEMMPLIDEFVRDLPLRVRRIEAAYAAENHAEFLVEIRQLKGEAGGYGFEPITAAAREVEETIRLSGPPEELRDRLAVLLKLCQSARPATCDAAEPTEAVEPDIDPALASALLESDLPLDPPPEAPAAA